MTRKIKILISVIIAVAIMITGSAATVMAEDDPANDTPVPTLYNNEDVIIELVNQAADEGLITPEEAEDIIAWWEDRPESVDKLFGTPGVFHQVRNRNWQMYSYKTKPTFSAAEGNLERSKLRIKYRLQNNNTNALGNGLQNQVKIQAQGISAVKMKAHNVLSASDN